ncbi:MAG TPA: heparinase II/III family protein [Candidatus Acidoferrum sp.]|nr:heparinase II/III family protein [Candidatus Acidoferrum sp.]
MRACALGALLLAGLIAAAPAVTNIEPARVKEIAVLLPPKPQGLGRPITDRIAWEKLAQTPAFASVIPNAEKLAGQPVPELPDELYLDYSRTGNRDRCQRVQSARSARITTFTPAECLEHKRRFVKPLTDTIEAICRERTWVYPAHDGKLDNFYGRTVEADLRATAVGWELGTADYLLGDTLAPATRRLIKQNVERRVLQPFRDMVEGRRKEIFWLRATPNWNAVCLAGTTGAALALEDSPKDRAWFVAAAEHYIRYFLKSFTPDGYCSEGIGYWNYGFGHFLMLGETIRQATGGRIDLLADPAALQPALFCTRAEILNGIFPTISDVHPGSRPDPQFVRFISERFGLKDAGPSEALFVKPAGSLAATMLFSFLKEPLPPIRHPKFAPDSPLRTWFNDGGVLICRPDPASPAPFAAALKGGNNAENHNHNDVGSFSVVSGSAMIVCDPGAEVYTARTFGAHRYDSKVLSSYGHAVPVVGGKLQQVGASAKAVVRRSDFSDAEDGLALDISSAYAVPELKRLERTFVFHRADPASLTVRDDVAFSAAESFETALITWGDWKKVSENELLFNDEGGAVRVRIDTGGKPFQISAQTLDENVTSRKKPARVAIALTSPIEMAVVSLVITPAE